MKFHSPHSSVSLAILAALLLPPGTARCGETASLSMEPLPPGAPRIVGNVADGTPSPPVPPKPDISANFRVLRETVRREDGRTVTYRRVEAPLPALPKPAPPHPDISDPAVRAAFAAAQAEEAKIVSRDILPFDVTVYDHSLSFVRWIRRDPETGEAHPFSAWLPEEIDASLLAGVGEIEFGSEGVRHRVGILLGATAIDTVIASREPAMAAQIPDLEAVRSALRAQVPGKMGQVQNPYPPAAPAAQAPSMTRDQSPNPPSFLLVEGDCSDTEATEFLDALIEILDREHDCLAAAREGRERARNEREAFLKAHPPEPRDIILNYSFGPARPAAKESNRKGNLR